MKQLEKALTTQQPVLENTSAATSATSISNVTPVTTQTTTNSLLPLENSPQTNDEIVGTKKITKKTTKKKYTLGKSISKNIDSARFKTVQHGVQVLPLKHKFVTKVHPEEKAKVHCAVKKL